MPDAARRDPVAPRFARRRRHMMELGLPSHVHFALCDTLVVFLDTKADRYRAVRRTPTLDALLTGASRGTEDEQLVRFLGRAGLLAPLGPDVHRCAPVTISVPRESALETGRRRAHLSLAMTVAVGGALLRSGSALRRHGLHAALERLRERKAQTPGEATDHAEIVMRSLAFADHRALLPRARTCLRDSLGLLSFLGDRAAGADLVLGVQAKPFYAHCWLQTDALILNDSGYFPSTLTPILRV
jgi:hypothetical protein